MINVAINGRTVTLTLTTGVSASATNVTVTDWVSANPLTDLFGNGQTCTGPGGSQQGGRPVRSASKPKVASRGAAKRSTTPRRSPCATCGLALVTTEACRAGAPTQEVLQTAVVAALDTLVAELVAERPADAAAYTERLRAYLEAYPAFYGSAAALLDHAGTVTMSPYVYRTADGYDTRDLVLPPYNIEAQEWLTMPLAANASIWTAPYFDAGGGEIWMITRSVPARDAEGIFAIVTTDLPVDAPAR